MKEEVEKIYLSIRSKKWSEMSDWEKFLDKERVKELKKLRRRAKHEVTLDPCSFEFMNL